MKRILRKRDNRGMSLVEVLCAVAILALVAGVIGSVIVVSTRTYSRGVSETNIQQEAQLAANNIGDIVKDACGVIYAKSGEYYIQDGEVYGEDGKPKVPSSVNPDEPEKGEAGVTELSIITNDDKQYTVKYYDSTYMVDDYKETLRYEVGTRTRASGSGEQLMAKNVSKFEADTTDFKNSKTITVTITVKDGEHEIPMKYTMTSRNEAGAGVTYTPTSESAAIALDENEVILVPGEEYEVKFSVLGGIKKEDLRWQPGTDGTDFGVPGTFDVAAVAEEGSVWLKGSARVKVPLNTDKKSVFLVLEAVDETGVQKAQATMKIQIRKVSATGVSYTVNTDHTASGMMEEAGAEYTFAANISGNAMTKAVGYEYDLNYKVAQAAAWSFQLTADGGNGDGSSALFGEYFEVLSNEEDVVSPKVVLRLKKEMPVDFKLTVRATSKHARGVNKANSNYYGEVSEPKNVYYAEAVVEPRPTLLKNSNDVKYVLLEPNETATVDVKVLGAGMSRDDTVSIDYMHDYGSGDIDSRSDAYDEDSNPNGTRATYKAATKTVEIKVGNDEKGHKGYNDGIGADVWDYNVYVNATTTSGQTFTIIVCISRIDVVSLELEHPASSEKGATEKNEDRRYRFNVRFNTDKEHKYTSLMRYLTSDADKTKRNFTTKFTITYQNRATGKTVSTYEVIIDGAGDVKSEVYKNGNGSVVSKDDKEKYDEFKKTWLDGDGDGKNDCSLLVTSSIGSTKVKDTNELNPNYEFINPSSTPHVYVGLADDYLPMNMRLTVRATVLHPTGNLMHPDAGGKWNNTGDWYANLSQEEYLKTDSGYTVEKYIEGFPTLVVAEPGQGIDDSGSAIKIPVHFTPEETFKSVEVVENSDKNTSAKLQGGNLVLSIGKDETGLNNTGLMKVKLTLNGKDSKGDAKEKTKEFILALRRVNEVDLKLSSNNDIKTLNKANATITLEAYPKGYGKNDVEYFEKQTYEYGGDYKSPYPMRWMMYYDKNRNGKQDSDEEKELKDWTDYFTSVSVNDKEYDEEHRESVTFKLLKPLPGGAELRAYPLHELGKVDKTKYNKSGNAYDDIYGVIVIEDDGLIVVTGGWKRGGTLDIAYNIPEENITYVNGRPFLVKDGQILWDGAIATRVSYKSKYNGTNQQGNHLFQSPSYFTHNPYDDGKGIGGERGQAVFEGKTLTEYTATIFAWGDRLEQSSFSSPYTTGNGAYIDLYSIDLKVNVGTTDVNATNTIAVDEKTYYIPDVVFQYQNSLPDTSKQKGDSNGAWTNKDGDNTLKVYVTPDDTISSYKSYYKLSEGWEETYEKYTLLPSRYVGVINDSKTNDNLDERLFGFSVTNTTGDGNEEGRSYVDFKFSKDVRSQYKGKVVKMIYEYNPYLCNTDNNSTAPYAWAYGGYKKENLDEIDGCDGILEFHFVDANINEKSDVTMPEVRYCPTYEENKSSVTPKYYYISEMSRFYIKTDGKTAEYQTGGAGKWKKQYSMTYENGKWTINK